MRRAQFAVAALPLVGGLLSCHEHDTPTEPRSIGDTFGRIWSVWVQKQALWPWARPVVNGATVIFATGDDRLIARDRRTGGEVWSTQVTSVNDDPQVAGENLVIAGGVVVAAVSRNTVGVDVSTGKQLWSYGAPSDTLIDDPGSAAMVAGVDLDADDSTVYVPAWGASLSAVNVRTGIARWVWRSPAGAQFRAGGKAARVSGDTVFQTVWQCVNKNCNLAEGWVMALDRRTGAEFGKAVIPAYTSVVVFNGGIALYQNLVIVTGPGGQVWAIDRSTYQVAWHYGPTPALTSTVAGPVLAGNVVYTDGGDEHAVGLRASDGAVVWRAPIESQATKGLFVSATRVYVPEAGVLNIIDRSSGRYVARIEQPNVGTNGSLFATPVTTFGSLVYATVGGAAWCFVEP
ncbi:MAG TPA: PQQ-binding-like beta-propeller repeat protein [Gemmatimonadaceae bacterium]